MRYALLIVLGLAIGIIGTTMTLNALNRGPHYPESLMHMMGYYASSLDKNVKANRCTVSDNLPQLQAMRGLSNDLEPILLPQDKEANFRQRASNLRAAIDAMLAAPPSTCATLGKGVNAIGEACDGCHKEYRD